jgi:hypothetical protein
MHNGMRHNKKLNRFHVCTFATDKEANHLVVVPRQAWRGEMRYVQFLLVACVCRLSKRRSVPLMVDLGVPWDTALQGSKYRNKMEHHKAEMYRNIGGS